MKKFYDVSVPFSGLLHFVVKAETPEEAAIEAESRGLEYETLGSSARVDWSKCVVTEED